MTDVATRRGYGLIASLAIADLRHEIILTGCIVLALTAIIAPLLLLLGLKHGVVENQLKALIEDPVYREIRPELNEELAPEWFDDLRQRQDIAFAVPTILRGASTVGVAVPEKDLQLLDLVPTDLGDPLLEENGAPPPGEGEVVLTQETADRTGLGVGDVVRLEIRRGSSRPLYPELTVVGVMEARGDPLARLYAPFDFVEDIETYRSGQPVPERDWPGEAPTPLAAFEGALVLAPEALERRTLLRLRSRTGFSTVDPVDRGRAEDVLGVPLNDDVAAYELRPRDALVARANLGELRRRLQGTGALILPLNSPMAVTLQSDSGAAETALSGLSVDEGTAARFGLDPVPWSDAAERTSPHAELAQLLVPEEVAAMLGVAAGDEIEIGVAYETYTLTLPATVAGTHALETVLAPAPLAGMLRSGEAARLVFDAESGQLLRTKDGYRGFRLYARSIYDVVALKRVFLDQDIAVITAEDDILRVQRTERALTRLFQFVAAIGLTGAVLAMVASLYASVERKRREIGIMRLLGLPRRAIVGFPTTQAVLIGIVAALIAVVVFLIFARAVNTYFASDLPLGNQLAFLPPSYLFYTVIIAAVVCAVSSIFASVRATRIDPAEAIREE